MIGKRIKALRKERKLTQEELGAMVGVKKAAIQKYESGAVVNLKQATIQKLCEVFGVSVVELFGEEGEIVAETSLIESVRYRFGAGMVEMMELFYELNDEGRQKCLGYASDIGMIKKYTSETRKTQD